MSQDGRPTPAAPFCKKRSNFGQVQGRKYLCRLERRFQRVLLATFQIRFHLQVYFRLVPPFSLRPIWHRVYVSRGGSAIRFEFQILQRTFQLLP
jgi:hypothetical protein